MLVSPIPSEIKNNLCNPIPVRYYTFYAANKKVQNLVGSKGLNAG